MPRFDEIELASVPLGGAESPLIVSEPEPGEVPHATRFNRLLTLLTDLSLFSALTLALSPLLPPSDRLPALLALGGFVLIVSYYYFVGMWLLWGRTIGGVIFGVRVVAEERQAMALREATLRWAGMLLSLATAGAGFLLALLPSRLSLADRMSGTRCVAS